MLPEGHAFDRSLCTACGACVAVCPNRALSIAGREVSVEEIMNLLEEDRVYFESSGGGLTISGGEPFFQAELTEAILKAASGAGFHSAVETNLSLPWGVMEPGLRTADLVMFDLKAADPEIHLRLTGIPWERVRDNTRRLAKLGRSVLIRIPSVAGVNDSESDARCVADLAALFPGLKYVEYLPYHRLGEEKYTSLGLPRPRTEAAPDQPARNRILAVFEARGIPVRGLRNGTLPGNPESTSKGERE
jgi:pyruvate formate lyase activating enzyme